MNDEILICKPDISDIKKASEIETENFPHPWEYEDFLKQSKDKNYLFLVAKRGESVIGYISIAIVLDEASINTIAVKKESRRQGAAQLLINESAKKLSERCAFLTLEVRKSNTAAISLYGKLGFEIVGERPRFYRDPDEDALLMTMYFC